MTNGKNAKGKLIVFGIIFWYPRAGVTYQFLHYLIGLRRLGWDVYYVEDSSRWVFDVRDFDLTPETCWRHSRLCIIEPGATGLRAVANTVPRWKGHEHDDKYPIHHENCGIAKTGEYPLWNPMPAGTRLPNRSPMRRTT
jgi:hypothetical protein